MGWRGCWWLSWILISAWSDAFSPFFLCSQNQYISQGPKHDRPTASAKYEHTHFSTNTSFPCRPRKHPLSAFPFMHQNRRCTIYTENCLLACKIMKNLRYFKSIMPSNFFSDFSMFFDRNEALFKKEYIIIC